ncbi:MAG: hypothetical protein AVDCRST_MAG68-5706 [uncultured Gemmatimonadetes bacterium]|uniref:Uncharacterized protein n=1 Tax=uncultured Gemmatimonadota bacterium TaxID=203437 RepID=A0A6J4MZG3_9BACT|nr:MAG: hypothetical protein AVDCRST_MAG68-5706 [uncultured Gemmatimonadota bacterium]
MPDKQKPLPAANRVATSPLVEQLNFEPRVQTRLTSILLRLNSRRVASKRWASRLAPFSVIVGWGGSALHIWAVYSEALNDQSVGFWSLLAALLPALFTVAWWIRQRFGADVPPKFTLWPVVWTAAVGVVLTLGTTLVYYILREHWVTDVFRSATLAAFILPYALLPAWIYAELKTSFPAFWAGRMEPEARAVAAFHKFVKVLRHNGTDRADLQVQEQLGHCLAEATSAINGTLPRILRSDPPDTRLIKRRESEAAVRTLRNAHGCLAPGKATDTDLINAGRSALLASVRSEWSTIADIQFGCAAVATSPSQWARRMRTALTTVGIALGLMVLWSPDVIDNLAAALPIGGPVARGALYLAGLASIVGVFSSDGPGSRAGRRALMLMASFRAPPENGPPAR